MVLFREALLETFRQKSEGRGLLTAGNRLSTGAYFVHIGIDSVRKSEFVVASDRSIKRIFGVQNQELELVN